VSRLESGEKPRWEPKAVGILEGADLVKLLAHSDSNRPVFELLAFSGLRIGEALGLRWGDVDFEAGVLRCANARARPASKEAQDPGRQA
jgi:integrase